mmetsp:Transcript_55415/g.89778  ORF Transcript_55415/g.89778 Transcript_55415/m.89778 type:complete len:82 (-) Transcript_55415:28-273(-)
MLSGGDYGVGRQCVVLGRDARWQTSLRWPEMGVGQRAVMTTHTHTTPSAVVRGGGLDLFPGTEARCWGGVQGEMMMPLCFF